MTNNSVNYFKIMRILLVNKFYYRRAGAEVYLLALEQALKDAGHEVAVLSTRHPETLPTPWSDYFIPYLPYSIREGFPADAKKFGQMIWSPAAYRSALRIIRDFKPDIVHIHNLYHHLSPSVLTACKKMGRPVVQTLHDYKLICPNYTLFTNHAPCERCHVFRYWNAVVYKCLNDSRAFSAAAALEMWAHRALGIYEKNVVRFITPSNFLRELLVRWGKDGQKIVHIPNLLDTSGLPPPSVEPGDGVLYAGRLVEWKGAGLIVEAAAAAPDLSFRVAGAGPLLAELQRRANTLGLVNIRFLGYLPREKVYEEMLGARAVAIPSIGYDPFPTAALEAGLLGRAVVASKIGGLPEIVRDGETGLLFEPGTVDALVDALRKLHYDSALSVRLGRAAERVVAELADPQRHVMRLMEVYKEVST
ncbi:glycosyltransferase [Patescibacteria group bacterium]|nr:MAG: glycosyltransferase [Patescibacteria group bacterium]